MTVIVNKGASLRSRLALSAYSHGYPPTYSAIISGVTGGQTFCRHGVLLLLLLLLVVVVVVPDSGHATQFTPIIPPIGASLLNAQRMLIIVSTLTKMHSLKEQPHVPPADRSQMSIDSIGSQRIYSLSDNLTF